MQGGTKGPSKTAGPEQKIKKKLVPKEVTNHQWLIDQVGNKMRMAEKTRTYDIRGRRCATGTERGGGASHQCGQGQKKEAGRVCHRVANSEQKGGMGLGFKEKVKNMGHVFS